MQCLVVDDSRVMRQVARQLYEQLGYSVEEAQDYDDALASCRRSMPDLIMLDLNVPAGNSPMFLHHLRRLEDGAKPRVLLLSTENDVELLSEALNAGADDYLLKPFDMETVQEKLKNEPTARA